MTIVIQKNTKILRITFFMKGMTYCESCDKEIKNDEWREHVIQKNN